MDNNRNDRDKGRDRQLIDKIVQDCYNGQMNAMNPIIRDFNQHMQEGMNQTIMNNKISMMEDLNTSQLYACKPVAMSYPQKQLVVEHPSYIEPIIEQPNIINSVISSTSTNIQEEQSIIITPVKIAKKIIILIACIGLFAYWFEPGFPLIAGIVMVGLALGFYKEIVYFFQERMA